MVILLFPVFIMMVMMQAEAAAKYGEELRTESQQASSFIYHLKRFNNWVKATVRLADWPRVENIHEVCITLCCHYLTIIRSFRHVTAYFKS